MTVKHSPHRHETDAPGKDSFRFWEAGAEKVVLAGPDSPSIRERTDTDLSLAQVCAMITDVDFIIVEDFKKEPGPKVGVFREGYVADLAAVGQGLIAVVGDYLVEQGVPCFSFEPGGRTG